MSHLLPILVSSAVLLTSLPGVRANGALSVEQWRMVEIPLTAAKPHPGPFRTVDVTATFTGPRGERIVRPAFWDGGSSWRIRFAPVAVGQWTYATSATDPSDPGLNGQSGAVRCLPYTGNLPVYRHGFLRVSDDRRSLAYHDGTPFLWLADTHWLWEKERLNESDRPGWPSEFRGMVDHRVEQGFTVYQVELFGRWKNAPLGGSAGKDQVELNIEHFQSDVDPKWQYLADRGLVVGATLGILDKAVTRERGELEARMARYVCARYGAYPAAWLMYQECTANIVGQFKSDEDRRIYMDVVRAVGESYRRSDDYHHVRTAHSDSSVVTAYRGEDWLDCTLFQGGHGKTIDRDRYYDFYFDPKVTLPQVEGEANYEHLFEGSLEHQANLVTTDAMREKAYQAMQCGCCGYTYGANGVWQATWSDERTGNQTVYGNTPWYVGIELPGGDQLSHWKAFYSALAWPTLRPRPACDDFMTWNAMLPADKCPAVASDPAASVVVVYFYRGQPFSGTLKHLQNGPYTARWFDPRSGTYTTISPAVVPRGGVWNTPPSPDDGDWVLLLTANKPTTNKPIPSRWSEVRTARAAERGKNAALRAKVSASSTDRANKVYDPRNAIDGNIDTSDWRHWSNDAATDTPSVEKPAWLLLEWDASILVKKILFFTMAGYETQDYEIQYRDGDEWKLFDHADVTGNTETVREHDAKTAVSTRAVRFLGKKGSIRQPEIVRVVELEVITP